MRILTPVVLALVLAAASGADGFRVLVTNDDGVAAPGLSAVVAALAGNPKLEVVVVAPATNQSGTGDATTAAPFMAGAATTAAGFPATAVGARPADTVLLAVRALLPAPPDVVVSGINSGQNVTREVADISGTVGAALTAGRLGIPAIAVSQGLGGADYSAAATWTANLVEQLRRKKSIRRKFEVRTGLGQAIVLNANFPSCATGALRGVALVPLGRLSTVVGYDLLSDTGTVRTWQAVAEVSNPFASDCTSTLAHPATDVEAMNNGLAAVTPLDPDLTVSGRLRGFRFVERVRFR
jgi:5'/3'-nucleotidase